MDYSQLIDEQKTAPEGKRGLYRAVKLPLGEVTRAYLFHDGSFNRDITRFVSTVNGRYRCGNLELDGRYDVHEKDGSVFFEKWEYDETGARVGEIEQRIACAACGGKWLGDLI